MPKNVKTKFSNHYNIKECIKNAHLVIGAVLLPGAKAPNLITKEMLKDLEKGTVLVDVAVDQGGCFETTKPTTHSDPTYIIDDVLLFSGKYAWCCSYDLNRRFDKCNYLLCNRNCKQRMETSLY